MLKNKKKGTVRPIVAEICTVHHTLILLNLDDILLNLSHRQYFKLI